MNKKRQTIWLVSMLSIMVILSAYYLFTDDLDEMKMASDKPNTDTIVMDMLNDADGGADRSDLLGLAGKDNVLSDSDVLTELESQTASVSGAFMTMEMERDDAYGRRLEELTAKSTDSTLPDEEVKAAIAEIQSLQATMEKIDMLEEQLMLNYGYENALIEQHDDAWTINIQAENLVNSEVVSILDLVMNELGIDPEDITVVRHS
jgi:stage III sporulation protein AH